MALEQKRRKDMEDHNFFLENERQLSSEAQTRLQAAAAEQSLRKGFEEHKRLDDVQRRSNLKRVTVPQKLRTVDDERPRAIETQSLVAGTQRLDHADDTVKPWQVAQMAGGEGRAKKVPILPTEISQSHDGALHETHDTLAEERNDPDRPSVMDAQFRDRASPAHAHSSSQQQNFKVHAEESAYPSSSVNAQQKLPESQQTLEPEAEKVPSAILQDPQSFEARHGCTQGSQPAPVPKQVAFEEERASESTSRQAEEMEALGCGHLDACGSFGDKEDHEDQECVEGVEGRVPENLSFDCDAEDAGKADLEGDDGESDGLVGDDLVDELLRLQEVPVEPSRPSVAEEGSLPLEEVILTRGLARQFVDEVEASTGDETAFVLAQWGFGSGLACWSRARCALQPHLDADEVLRHRWELLHPSSMQPDQVGGSA